MQMREGHVTQPLAPPPHLSVEARSGPCHHHWCTLPLDRGGFVWSRPRQLHLHHAPARARSNRPPHHHHQPIRTRRFCLESTTSAPPPPCSCWSAEGPLGP